MSAVYFGDLKNTALVKPTLSPAAALTANTNGASCDMQLGGTNNCNAMLIAGAYDIASGNETYAIAIEESSDGITWTALPIPAAFTGKTFADPGTAYVEMIFFQRTKRYLRAVLTVAGTSPSFLPSIVFIERKTITGAGDGHQG